MNTLKMEWFRQLPSTVRIILVFVLLWNIYRFISKKRRERKAAALGGFALSRRSYIFGFDIIYEFMNAYTGNYVLEFWFRHFKKYGNSSNPWTFAIGPRASPVIFTAEPENIKAVLATQFEDFGKGEEMYQAWRAFLGEGIFTQDGQKWHEARKLIRPQFVKDRLSNIKVFEYHAQILLPMLRGEGQTVNLSNLFFRFSLDAATDFLFGRSVDSLVYEQAAFANAFDYIQRAQVRILSLGMWAFAMPRKRLRQELEVLENFIAPYIDQALQLSSEELEQVTQSDTDYTFLHALAAHTRDRKVLRDQIVSMLLAGRDTTACTLSWLFYELSVHPHVVDKLRKEILQQVGPTRAPTYADLKNMRYLQHTMNETLRLYPVVPYNSRAALRDTTLPRGGGPDGNSPIAILKDTVINYSTLAMQRREDLYPASMLGGRAQDASSEKLSAPYYEFAPDRWDHWTPKTWQYVPFNGGPRICIGQQFALTEMSYTVTRILQRFDRLEYRGNGHPGLHAEIVLAPAKPVLVGFFDAKYQK